MFRSSCLCTTELLHLTKSLTRSYSFYFTLMKTYSRWDTELVGWHNVSCEQINHSNFQIDIPLANNARSMQNLPTWKNFNNLISFETNPFANSLETIRVLEPICPRHITIIQFSQSIWRNQWDMITIRSLFRQTSRHFPLFRRITFYPSLQEQSQLSLWALFKLMGLSLDTQLQQFKYPKFFI